MLFFISSHEGTIWNMVASANNGGVPITVGEWHHVAGTYEGRTIRGM